ncbi:MAG TPA: tautomerase family protein [Burkholderiaceae bacterium]|jgi:phenylpyruvate tautomerase PptA (4-oxalocrotonate tautomerase family)|nr:tautomerase family protein [Burkholderiaceae bacterium]
MPMSRISLLKGKSPEYLRAVSDSLHQALVDTFGVPADDRFQVIHQHEAYEMSFDRHYLGGPRSDDYMLICVTAGRARSAAVKQAFYRRLVGLLAESPGVRPQDVMVVINTTQADDWSFAGGELYAPGDAWQNAMAETQP